MGGERAAALGRRPRRLSLAAEAGDGTVEPTPEAPFSALVFKTMIDRYTGTLSVLRVVSGDAASGPHPARRHPGSKERIGKLMLLRGGDHVDVPEAGPGDVVAVAKLRSVHRAQSHRREGRRPTARNPHSAGCDFLRHDGDEDGYASLGRLVEEDRRSISGARPRRASSCSRAWASSTCTPPCTSSSACLAWRCSSRRRVPYRETVTRRAENVEGKLKQSGGKGMYGVCYLTVEPKPRGEESNSWTRSSAARFRAT